MKQESPDQLNINELLKHMDDVSKEEIEGYKLGYEYSKGRLPNKEEIDKINQGRQFATGVLKGRTTAKQLKLEQ